MQHHEIKPAAGHRINASLVVSSLAVVGGSLHAGLEGMLKHDATDPLHIFFTEQMRQYETGNLRLNCLGLTFVDSQGLALLLMLHRLCLNQGGALVIESPPPMLAHLLKLTRFDSIIRVEAAG